MESFLNIPVTFTVKERKIALKRISIEDSIIQFITLLVNTHQGECVHNSDFGYSIWSNEFEPILNTMQWQPRFVDQVKYLIEKYEPRIRDVLVKEPEIKALDKQKRADKDYRITLNIEYTIKSSREKQHGIKICFDY